MNDIDIRDLFTRYSQEIQTFLRRRVACRHTAADLMQDLFVRLMTLPRTDDIDNPRAYLYRAAANIAVNHQIAEARRRARVEKASSESQGDVDTVTPERILSDRDRLGAMAMALDELPPLTRTVFTLIRIEGFKQAAVADQLGIHITTVEKNLRRAAHHCFTRMLEFEESSGSEHSRLSE